MFGIRRSAIRAAAIITGLAVCAVTPAVADAGPGQGSPQRLSSSARSSFLHAVAVVSRARAWAVGEVTSGPLFQTLILHWNGRRWRQVASPSPAGLPSTLSGVASASPASAWAVGAFFDGTAWQTLILHWNGRRWRLVPSPDPAGRARDNELMGVTATSRGSAWAVGFFSNGHAAQTLILHWNGRRWRQVPSPDPAGPSRGNFLGAVAATSARNAWAVGSYRNAGGLNQQAQTLILRWNGQRWRKVASPSPGLPAGSSALSGVAATSVASAWAVGDFFINGTDRTLAEHWNGRNWRVMRTPNPAGPNQPDTLAAVTAVSRTNAWAVGELFDDEAFPPTQTLILHWNGRRWAHVASPSPGAPTRFSGLSGVAAASATSVWAVGAFFNGTAGQALIEHWNGRRWGQVASPNP
jgi:hypothetical protein